MPSSPLLDLGPLNPTEAKFAPKEIFYAGHPDILDRGFRVSIVGSRDASPDGLRRAKRLAEMVCERQGVVVSGLAKGIDTAAHRAAIDAGGRTIAVLGTPLSKSYPAENAELQRLIMSEYLCLSQFPPGRPTQPRDFPLRNRTMALISDATVIVEAGVTSGSISQGWEALRLGRGLFIAESLVNNPKLPWPKEMMGYGAQVLSSETMEEFFETLPARGEIYDPQEPADLVLA